MKILFIDETEKQKANQGKNFFILVGMMVNSDKILKLHNDLKSIIDNYNLENFKLLRKEKSITKETKIKITSEIVNILSKENIIILASILGDISLNEIKEISQKYIKGIKFLIERFFIELGRINDVGLLVMDTISRKASIKIRDELYEFLSKEKLKILKQNYKEGRIRWLTKIIEKGSYKERIFPELYFSDDKYNNILGVTDLIAACLQKAFNKAYDIHKERIDLEKLYEFNNYLKVYWSLFKRDEKGKVRGWGIKLWW